MRINNVRTPTNHRTAAALIVIAGLGASAQAQFIGIELREDKSPPSAEGLQGFPGDDRVRIFNFYAMFDGPGAAAGQPGEENVVVNVGVVTGPVAGAEGGFGVNIERNPNASFYRAPLASGAPADGVGGINEGLAGDNRREWGTFVSIGVKRYDSYYSDTSDLPDHDSAGGDTEFEFLTRGDQNLEDRPPLQRFNWIKGGWFNSTPTNAQGAAQDLGDGSYGVFLAQLAVMDLAEGADIGSGGVAQPGYAFGSTFSTWYGDVFISGLTGGPIPGTGTHDMVIFTNNPAGIAFANYIAFDVPTPGALALFTLAGAAAARRRRS
ncbi:MAG: hypothetical protein EA376_14695 [Phycisphaeraceae bacterium]|nr:MAG: hypothetical protein EA376_14695 [Phycisphaeraceae bacterium]